MKNENAKSPEFDIIKCIGKTFEEFCYILLNITSA